MAAAASRAIFITLEGGEGSGKSTLASGLTEVLRSRGLEVCATQEPGGTNLGRAIQGILEESLNSPTPLGELLLFEADRAQHMSEVVFPALAAGMTVICDRFTDSSIAYQGYGRGIDLELIRRLNHEATAGLRPDLTLLLDLPPEVGLSREGDQKDVTGRESLEFHERVRSGFLELAKEEPERFVLIDAQLTPEQVTQQALAAVERVLPLARSVG
jgi:dTMP kinase